MHFFRYFGWIYAYQAHHSAVFVLQKMAMIRKSANDRWVAEIHTKFYAGILFSFSIPERKGTLMTSRRNGSLTAIPNHSVSIK
jgi:hypothetical protein